MADSAHCTSDLEMAENQESPFVDVNSLLEGVLFPVYRPRILNPVNECDKLQQYRPDPDSRLPTSFQGFIERVSTFKPQVWGGDPNAALYFAKYGWRGSSNCNIRCNMCATSIDGKHVMNKGKLLFVLAKEGHDKLCPFQFISTTSDLFKLPTDPEIIQRNVTKIWGGLISLEMDLPSITEDVISDLGIENKVVELFFKALDSPVTEFGLSALVLVLCGWVKGSSKNTVECNFCQRCVGLWNFFSIADKAHPPEPVPSSSTEVPSCDKASFSPKPGSTSACSEQTPSQEIIPSDCEVPLDSNDYVSEECSEGTEVMSVDDFGEEEDGHPYYTTANLRDVKSTYKPRPRSKQTEIREHSSEEHSEVSDEEVGSAHPGFEEQDRDSTSSRLDIYYKIQYVKKLKKRAIKLLYERSLKFADGMNETPYPGVQAYLDCRTDLPIGQAIDTPELSQPPDSDDQGVEDEEGDNSNMEWNEEKEETLQETNPDDVCNGPTENELPDNIKLVAEFPSSEADEGSHDPLDTPGTKRTHESISDESDSSSVKRRKTVNDLNAKENVTLVNVKDITSRLSEHGVTITKCSQVPLTSQKETNESRDRGVKRKATSLDLNEEEEIHIVTRRPRKDDDDDNDDDYGKTDVRPRAELLKDKLENENSDSNCKESDHITNDTVLPHDSIVKLSKKASEDVGEIPVGMRNGTDSSKPVDSENNSHEESITPNEEDRKINTSDERIEEITPVENTVRNGDIKSESSEGESIPKITNGDSAVLSPDSKTEGNKASDEVNGKLKSENTTSKLESENATADNENELKGKHGEISVKKAEVDAKGAKLSEPSAPECVLTGNHVEDLNQSEGTTEISAKSLEGAIENIANPIQNDSQITCNSSVEDSSVVTPQNPAPEDTPQPSDHEQPSGKDEEKKCSDSKEDEIIPSAESTSNAVEASSVKTGTSHTSDIAANSEVILADSKPVLDSVKSPCDSSEDIKSKEDMLAVEAQKEQSTQGKKSEEESSKEKDSGSEEKVETVLKSDDVEESHDAKNNGTGSMVDSSSGIVENDDEKQESTSEKDNDSAEVQPVDVQDKSVTVEGMDSSSNINDTVMEVEDSEEGIRMKNDTSKESNNENGDNKNQDERMEVASPTKDLPCEEQKESDGDIAASGEEVVSRKRRHSSVEEEDGEDQKKDDHKKFKSDQEVVPKVDFHPVKEHRFWCIYRLNTECSNGETKPGWAQIRDGLRLGLSMEFAPRDEDFRMRLAKHLAHW